MQNESKKLVKLKGSPSFGANQFARAAAFLMSRAHLKYQKATKNSLISTLRTEVLSCMALSVYEVVGVACSLLHSRF